MNNRMLEIAKYLGTLYADKARTTSEIVRYETEISYHRLMLTPNAGWPGKNEAERFLSKERAEDVDEQLQNQLVVLRDLNYHLVSYNAEILRMEAERRALEWIITERMVGVLESRDGRPVAQAEAIRRMAEIVETHDF